MLQFKPNLFNIFLNVSREERGVRNSKGVKETTEGQEAKDMMEMKEEGANIVLTRQRLSMGRPNNFQEAFWKIF